MTTASWVPLHDRLTAVARLEDVRDVLEAVRDSTLPGTGLYLAMEQAIGAVSRGLRNLP